MLIEPIVARKRCDEGINNKIIELGADETLRTCTCANAQLHVTFIVFHIAAIVKIVRQAFRTCSFYTTQKIIEPILRPVI